MEDIKKQIELELKLLEDIINEYGPNSEEHRVQSGKVHELLEKFVNNI